MGAQLLLTLMTTEINFAIMDYDIINPMDHQYVSTELEMLGLALPPQPMGHILLNRERGIDSQMPLLYDFSELAFAAGGPQSQEPDNMQYALAPQSPGPNFHHWSETESIGSHSTGSSLESGTVLDQRLSGFAAAMPAGLGICEPHSLLYSSEPVSQASVSPPWDAEQQLGDDIDSKAYLEESMPSIVSPPLYTPYGKPQTPQSEDCAMSQAGEDSLDDITGPSTPDDCPTDGAADDSDYLPGCTRKCKSSSVPKGLRNNRTSFRIHKSPRTSNRRQGRTRTSPSLPSLAPTDLDISGTGTTEVHHFTCPLTPYGCTSHFKSKNEWKRHVFSLHIAIGFWRCRYCADPGRPNIFYRKDLFTAHLTRMHFKPTPSPDSSSQDTTKSSGRSNKAKGWTSGKNGRNGKSEERDEALTRRLEATCERCWVDVRDAPMTCKCVICLREYIGPRACDEWLEHVGQHLLDFSRRGYPEFVVWEQDRVLASWLLNERLLESEYPGKPGPLRLADREIADTEALEHRGAIHDDELDGEGEVDD